MKKSIVSEKSYSFAIDVVNLYKQLSIEKKEFVLSKQLLRSGTAIGALIREAEHAQSSKDFVNKMNIALKEANETLYWVQLLFDTDFISVTIYNNLFPKCQELNRLLAAIVKTTKSKLT